MSQPFVLSLIAFAAVLLLLDRAWDYRLPYVAAVALFIALQFAIGLFRRTPAGEVATGQDWPTSGPIGRFGQRGLTATFALSGLLCLLNPRQLWQIVRQATGNRTARRRRPDTSTHRSVVAYALPFDGEWLVYNGGTTPATSHSWDVVAQRYAYDFVVADDRFIRHEGPGTSLEQYFAYGRVVRAAADGVAVKVLDGVRDAPLVGYGIVDCLAANFVGNHAIIRHAEGEYGVYAHLIPGSLRVTVGDTVARGQEIGRCGHSGHSSEPHLHFHVQDVEDFYSAAGLPIHFSDVVVNGAASGRASLTAGDRVRPGPR